MQTNFIAKILCGILDILQFGSTSALNVNYTGHFHIFNAKLCMNSIKADQHSFNSAVFLRIQNVLNRKFDRHFVGKFLNGKKDRIPRYINLYRCLLSYGIRACINGNIFVIEFSKWALDLVPKWKYLHGCHDYFWFILLSLTQIYNSVREQHIHCLQIS